MHRERVKVRDQTVVADNGALLRGAPVWLYGYGEEIGATSYALDPSYYRELARAGLNAIRVVCFDPWQRSEGYPHWDLNVSADRVTFLERLDRVVDLAGRFGLYVMVGYHDIARYDMEYATSFWRLVAPRYALRPHVFYELLNEPAGWSPDDYDERVLGDHEALYDLVRENAPDVHIVLLTFANTAWDGSKRSIREVAAELGGVDWSNASVGFHPYSTLGSSRDIVELKKRFPVINTEMDVPHFEGERESTPVAMDGEEWGFETMERLGISWFSWNTEGSERFRRYLVDGVLEDARRKGYLWRFDPETGAWSAEQGVRSFLRRFPVAECARVMGLSKGATAVMVVLTFLVALFDASMLALLVPIAQGVTRGDFGFIFEYLPFARDWFDTGSLYSAGFLTVAAAVFVAGVARSASAYSLHVYQGGLYGRCSRNLADFAVARYLKFGKAYFDRRSEGEVIGLVDCNHDVLNVYQASHRALSTAFILAGYLAVLLLISWKLTLVVAVLFPLWHLAMRRVVARTATVSERIQQTSEALNRGSYEILSQLALFRLFAKEDVALAGYRRVTEQRRQVEQETWRLRGTMDQISEIGVLLALVALLAVVVYGFGETDPTQMVLFLVYFFVARTALPRISAFGEVALEFAEKSPRALEFAELFDDDGKFIIPDGDQKLRPLERGVEVKGLTFAYPGGAAVLRDVSLLIEKGRTTALVGPSAAGKTTLAHLLLRLYDVQPETIFFDDVDIRDLRVDSLRGGISVVSQDIALLGETLESNLLFGVDREVPREELMEVIEAARLGELCDRLEKGIDTPIGDQGQYLSGGEKQRVALARALLKDSSLLILDEATSSLDARNEQLVREALEVALEGRTALVIAHRFSTIQAAKKVVVLDHGRVVEQGSPEQLLEQKGLFHELWQAQKFY